MELYYLYETSPKRKRELKTLAEAVNKTAAKPRATGMRWIDHKYQAMKNVFKNLGVYITHIEYLTQTPPSKNESELQGFLRRCKQEKYPYGYIFRCASSNVHDPVKAVKCVKDFTWAMVKLTLLMISHLNQILVD